MRRITRSKIVRTSKKRSKKWLTKRTQIAILNKLSRKTQASSKAKKTSRKASEDRREHLENYIVQETKNKPVILRQEHCKVLKLKNENNATNLSERTK